MTTERHSARYSHFESILDCENCGEEIRVEADVTNGDVLICPGCYEEVEVYGR